MLGRARDVVRAYRAAYRNRPRVLARPAMGEERRARKPASLVYAPRPR